MPFRVNKMTLSSAQKALLQPIQETSQDRQAWPYTLRDTGQDNQRERKFCDTRKLHHFMSILHIFNLKICMPLVITIATGP